MFGTGAWANANGVTTTGLDDVDLWVGGLAELTNQNGGMLGSTFNYVFQTQLEKLQDGDRLYYLARTPGLNLRTQLEGNSFAELIERNTARHQHAEGRRLRHGRLQVRAGQPDVPATAGRLHRQRCIGQRRPDHPVQREQAAAAQAGRHDPVPSHQQRRSARHQRPGRLQRLARERPGLRRRRQRHHLGQRRQRRPRGQQRGRHHPRRQRQRHRDRPRRRRRAQGRPRQRRRGRRPRRRHRARRRRVGLPQRWADDNEEFAGPGNDYIIAGEGADTVFGDGGDDWIEGGTGQDLLQGDHGAPFFDDPGQTAPGNDIFIGQPGENDYDAEGGDDLMAQNPAIDRNAGAAGFDWAIPPVRPDARRRRPGDQPAVGHQALPVQVVVNRDRWQETEADSGSPRTTSSAATTWNESSARVVSPAATRSTRPVWPASPGWTGSSRSSRPRWPP